MCLYAVVDASVSETISRLDLWLTVCWLRWSPRFCSSDASYDDDMIWCGYNTNLWKLLELNWFLGHKVYLFTFVWILFRLDANLPKKKRAHGVSKVVWFFIAINKNLLRSQFVRSFIRSKNRFDRKGFSGMN